MRVSTDFIMREIAGEFILVPTGAAAAKFNGLITMNEVGKFIFQSLSEERTAQQMVSLLTAEYTVDAETVRQDLDEFLQQLRQIGALVEDAQ